MRVTHGAPSLSPTPAHPRLAWPCCRYDNDACRFHRDGASLAVELINNLNGGRGFRVGFERRHFVKFYHRSALVRNAGSLGVDGYNAAHGQLAATVAAGSEVLIGSCSHKSIAEKSAYLAAERPLMAQVGPDTVYDGGKHKWLFG